MKVETLVSSMYQEDYNLVSKMNIQTDAIIINQGNINKIDEFKYRDNNIRFLSFNERGVGLSRNTALMRSKGDICIFADEDLEYVDGYEKIIVNEFLKNPSADIILFNVLSNNPERPNYIIKKVHRVKIYNCLRYGAVRIAVKTQKVKEANVFFSLMFGGGAKYSCGEDSLFLAQCIKNGLKVYTSPKIIGSVSQKESTWFNGYTDKFFIDKGVFFKSFSKKLSYLLCLQFVIRHYRLFKAEKNSIQAYKLMCKGIKEI